MRRNLDIRKGENIKHLPLLYDGVLTLFPKSASPLSVDFGIPSSIIEELKWKRGGN